MKHLLIIPVLLLALLGGCLSEDEKEAAREEPWFLFKKKLEGYLNDGQGMILGKRSDIYVRLDEEGDYLSRLNRQGNTLWKRSFGRQSFSVVRSMAADSLSNVYIVGHDHTWENRGLWDMFLFKHSGDGDQLFKKEWGTKGDDEGYDVAVDSRDNVYVAAKLRVTHVEYIGGRPFEFPIYAIFLYKLDSRGILEWEKIVLKESVFQAKLAVDSRDNIYVATEDGYPYRMLLFKYDGDGNLIWEREKKGPFAEYDNLKDMVIDGEDSIHIAGDTYSDMAGEYRGSSDIFRLKYDPDGNLIGQDQWGTGGYEKAAGAAMDAEGNLYIAGYSATWAKSMISEIVILKYDIAGKLVAEKKYGNREEEHETRDMVIDEDGYIYLVASIGGSNYLLKLPPIGDQSADGVE